MGCRGKNAETFKANVNVILLFSATIQLNWADRSFHRNGQENKSSVKKIHLKEKYFSYFHGSVAH